jgi:glycosyltransferase involved in cell wall biosynthesis
LSSRRPVVYVSPYYPPFGAGGAERTASLHAQVLVRSGQPVVVVTPNFGAPPEEDVNGVRVVRIDIGHRLAQGGQVSERVFERRSVSRRLSDAISTIAHECDAFCIHAQHPAVIAAANQAASQLELPLVAHLRDTGLICAVGAICLMEPENAVPPSQCSFMTNLGCRTGRWNRLYQADASWPQNAAAVVRGAGGYLRFKSRLAHYANARRIAFASAGLLDLYAHRDDFKDRGRLRVVYAPVLESTVNQVVAPLPPSVREAMAAGHKLILFVGKVSKGKGADVMFAAFKNLRSRYPNARLVVCGNLHSRDWDVDPERTILLGFVDQSTLTSLYAACDVVLLPSTWPEPLGWATLDSGRHAKPIVATRVGGIPEAVDDGVTGLLVEKGDAFAMSEALARILDDPEWAAGLGQAARSHILGRFGEDAVRRQLESLYEGVN